MEFVITAGHSDVDPGAVRGQLKEAELAERLRNIVAKKLREEGHTVYTDGIGEKNLPLTEAIALVKAHPKAIALEIHFNASDNASARGVETISLPPRKTLSKALSKAVSDVTGDKLRGDAGWIDQSQSARGKLGIVNAGAMLIEVAFISNQASMDAYLAKEWLVASAIVKELVGGKA